HLGHAFEGVGDDEGARHAWLAGIEAARRRPVPFAPDSLAYVALMHRDLARGVDITPLLDEAIALFPGNHAVHWIEARALLRHGPAAEALPIFEGLAAVDTEALVEEDPLAYDTRIFGAWAVAGLALCCFRLGRYEESVRHYARAEALEPEDPGHAVRRRLAEARARQASGSGIRAVAAAPA